MKAIFALTLFLMSFSAFAGGTSGGGGKGVVCIDSAGQETVELLDIWEARTLFKQTSAPFPPGTTLKTAVEILIDRLKYVFPTGLNSGFPFQQGEDFKKTLLIYSSSFLGSGSEVIRLHDVELEITDDSFELAKPKYCEVRQLVNYQDYDHIYLDEDRFQNMDLLNQAALIAHEVLYRYLRSFGDTNSIRARRAVGYVSAGLSFSNVADFHIPKSYVKCTNIRDSEFSYEHDTYDIDFWPATEYWSNKNSLQVLPNVFDEAQLMGVTNWNMYQTAGGTFSYYEAISTGKCPNSSMTSDKWEKIEGPIEFDRGFWLGLRCDQKTNALTVTARSRRPGSKQWSDPVQLICKEHSQ